MDRSKKDDSMKARLFKIVSLFLVLTLCFSVVGCSNKSSVSSQTEVSSEGASIKESDDLYKNVLTENIEKGVFPMFCNKVDYSRGGSTTTEEAYLDYKKYIENRHEFSDMIGHSSEVSAVRLAEWGIFEKTENFLPEDNMTVAEFLNCFLRICKQDLNANSHAEKIKSVVEATNLLEDGISLDYQAPLSNELLAYFLYRANEAVENAAQYAMQLDDYDTVAEEYRVAVLQCIAAGLIEIKDFKFNPSSPAKRSDIADGLYRLVNAGARVIPLYDLGNLYSPNENIYLVKSSYETNDSGTQFGFFTNYNRQVSAYENFGKMAIDRTGFYKWVDIEKQKGIYTMPNFNNDKSSHKAGNTIINCVDITANLVWNKQFDRSNIPSFYEQNISDTATRTAAKQFLFAFVKEMMNQVKGDVYLSIDYELDWQQAIYNDVAGWNRAKIFSKWFVEACEVARQAATAVGAGSRLKIIVIYNNITGTHLRGVKENQWMIDMANAVDIIGIDSYNFYEDQTDPSYTIQNFRFLMNNYSLGKPVIMVENGLGMLKDGTIDAVTGLAQSELVATYYKNLFRELPFACERGDFLNANFTGYLIWSYFDTENVTKEYGIVDSDNNLRANGEEVLKGIKNMYKQKQFYPSYLKSVSEASITATEVSVTSGTKYDKLTYLVNGLDTVNGSGIFRIKLKEKGTVMLTVNGEKHFATASMSDSHVFEIEGLRDGLNVIDIYFGSEQTPFTQTVEKVLLS